MQFKIDENLPCEIAEMLTLTTDALLSLRQGAAHLPQKALGRGTTKKTQSVAG